MKMKKIITKVLCCALTIGILGTALPKQFTTAANAATKNTQKIQSNKSNTKVLSEDSTFKVTETENVRTVLNKKTLETVTVTFTDSQHSKGTYKDVDGNVKDLWTNDKGSVYLDGKCIIETKTSPVAKQTSDNLMSSQLSSGYYNSDFFYGNGHTYYYVSTRTYNTQTAGSDSNIAMGILALMPYAGLTIGLVGIIQGFQHRNDPIMYIEEKMYCTSSYQFYAYKNYFYSDSNYSDLEDSNTVYKTMW